MKYKVFRFKITLNQHLFALETVEICSPEKKNEDYSEWEMGLNTITQQA